MDLLLDNVEIPEGTTEITETTFMNHRLVSSVTIPDSVLVIGEKAFADCVNLKSITLPKGLMAIGKEAFMNCTSLESIEIPEGITSIEYGTFADCCYLESVTLPESITAIKERAFASCTGIKNIIIPDNLISCAPNSFPSQKYVTINKAYKYENSMLVNTANGMLLYYNGTMKNVIVPGEIKGIGFRAFRGCTLQTVRLSEGITSISDEAFTDCGDEARILLPESIDYIENSAFDGNTKVFCLKGSYAENWCRNNADYKHIGDEVA